MALTQVDQGLLSSTAQYTGFKNRIINGAINVWQRGTSFSGLTNAGSYTADRWQFGSSGTGVCTISQSTDVPSTGTFTYSALWTVTTAQSSLSAGNYYQFNQRIEGYNTADLRYGTSAAATITLSFWVKSSVTGTYSVAVNRDAASTYRAYVTTYTINSANTWEQKTITVPGDTSIAPNSSELTTGSGLYLGFQLGTGSTYQTSTLNSWQSAVVVSSSTTTNLFATNGATWQVTGVQLEKGSTATSFDYRPYGTELQLCQRYYQTSTNVQGIANGSTTMIFNIGVQVAPRAQPTVNLTGVYSVSDIYTADQTQSAATMGTFYGWSPNALLVGTASWSGLTAGRTYLSRYNNSNVFTLSAEL